jgi:hypothetical protein
MIRRSAVLALLLLLTACPSQVPDDPSGPVGATAGTGGSGNSPASGGSGGSPSTADAATSTPTGAITPLSPKTFVFERELLRGMDGTSRIAARHLYAYDLDSRAERLLTNFDDPGQGSGKSVLPGFSVSPDRKWIAFGSTNFRQSFDDGKWTFKTSILWAVSADGQQFRRLTPPPTERWDQTIPCATQSQCIGFGERCNALFCVRDGLNMFYQYPVWSADGETVYFAHTLFWTCPGINISRLCLVTFLRGASGGQITDNGPELNCATMSALSLNRTGDGLLVHQGNYCSNGGSGLHEYAVKPLANKRTLISDPPYNANPRIDPYGTATWLPDGSGVLYIATGILKQPPRSGFRMGLYQWSASTQTTQPVYEPTTDDIDIKDVTAAASGEIVLEVETTTGAAKSTDLYLFEREGAKLTRLTTSGNNSTPRF